MLLTFVPVLATLVVAVDPLVKLPQGSMRGTALSSGVTQWLGVPFAVAPVGRLRFAAPEPPPPSDATLDCSKFRPICLPRQPSDFTMQPNKRFTVSEDCLFLNIFAPSNATAGSQLGVFYMVQGGGFQSNSNANFNGTDLAAFANMVVVQINYRVGPFGYAQSKEIQAQGSLNNGLKDVVRGLEWVKKNINMFGGNPDQVVMMGDSAGATSAALLMAAFADKDPGLFKGIILESVSEPTLRTMEQGQEQYDCLTKAAGCSGSADTLACLRSVNASALQTEECQFNPHFDDDLVKMTMFDAFKAGRVLKVPTIAGTCTDEGTKNVPQNTDNVTQALEFMNSQAQGALSNASLDVLTRTYLDTPQPVFPKSGRMWRQLANAMGDFRAHCITARVQNGIVKAGAPTWNYRYNVLDPEQEELGFGAYHTVELNGVFGPNNTDGAPPKSYRTTNAPIVPITMAYWSSFVKSLDPNKMKLADTPDWQPWTIEGRQRLRFQTGDMGMEAMNATQNARCDMLDPMMIAIEKMATPASVNLVAPGGGSSSEAVPMQAEAMTGTNGTNMTVSPKDSSASPGPGLVTQGAQLYLLALVVLLVGIS